MLAPASSQLRQEEKPKESRNDQPSSSQFPSDLLESCILLGAARVYLSDTQEGYSPRFSEILTPGDWPLFRRLVISRVWLGVVGYVRNSSACCRSCGALCCCYSFCSWGERVRARARMLLGSLPPFAVVVVLVLARARSVEQEEEEVSILHRFVRDLPEGVS